MSVVCYDLGESGFHHVILITRIVYPPENDAMIAWCEEHLGRGGFYEDTRWANIGYYYFMFAENNDAFTFRMRWG